ncbi:AraC-type DNA-binding domain-containing protein [Perkinsela sp. CCAP 1560/4]|nr:AraC-type DNA-binding domain-containing protein [Perkinsela sp. CCAP 1560/4]|eukprot:KNH08063.1 AraC-type DNA-binding domain-containing protein [Perkinsela sp. CCAP 1560/4]
MVATLSALIQRSLAPKVLNGRDLSSVYFDLMKLDLVDRALADDLGKCVLSEVQSIVACKDIALTLSAMSTVKLRHEYVHSPSLHALCSATLERVPKFQPFELITSLNAMKRFPKAVPVQVLDELMGRVRDLSVRFSDREVHLLLDICGKLKFEGVAKEMDSLITTLVTRRKSSPDLLDTFAALRALTRQKNPCTEHFTKILTEFQKNFPSKSLTKENCLFTLYAISNKNISLKEQNACLKILIENVRKDYPEYHRRYLKDILVAAAKIGFNDREILDRTYECFKRYDLKSYDDFSILQILASHCILKGSDPAISQKCVEYLRPRKLSKSKVVIALIPFPTEAQISLADKINDLLGNVEKKAVSRLPVTQEAKLTPLEAMHSPKDCIAMGSKLHQQMMEGRSASINLFDIIEFFEHALKSPDADSVGKMALKISSSIDAEMKRSSDSSFNHFSFMNNSQILTSVRFLTAFQVYSDAFFEKIMQIYFEADRKISIALDIEVITYIGAIKGCVKDKIWEIILSRLQGSIDQLDSFGVVRILVAALTVQDNKMVSPKFLASLIRHLARIPNTGSTELAIALHSMHRLYLNEPVLFNTLLRRYLALPLDLRSTWKVFVSVSQYRYLTPVPELIQSLFARVRGNLRSMDHHALIKILISTASFRRLCGDVLEASSEKETLICPSISTLVTDGMNICANLRSISSTNLSLLVLSLARLGGFEKTVRSAVLYNIERKDLTLLSRTTLALAIMLNTSDEFGSFLATVAHQYITSLDTLLSFERLAFNAFLLYPFFVEKGFLQESSAMAARLLTRASEAKWKIYHIDDLMRAFECCLRYPIHQIPKSLLICIYKELKERNQCLTASERSRLHSLTNQVNSSGVLSAKS